MKGVNLPGPTVGEIAAALDGQTARLTLANGRTSDLIALADACQAQQAQTAKALAPRPWWRFTP